MDCQAAPAVQQQAMRSVFVQVSFFIFGTAVLLPWNCILSAMAYMDLVAFPGRGWTLLVSPLFNGLSLTTQALMLFAGEFFTTWKIICFALPVGAACSVVVLLCLSTSVVSSEALGFCGALGGCLCLAVSISGLLQCSTASLSAELMAEHGPLPAHLSNGLAMAGIVSLVVASAVSASSGQALAAKALFLVSAAIIAICIFPLVAFLRTGTIPLHKEERSDEWPSSPALSSASSEVRLARADCSREMSPGIMRRRSSVERVSSGVARAWKQEINLCANYVQTFLVFPAVTLKWVPSDGFMSQENYGLLMVSTFQVFDLVGRLICTWPQLLRLFPPGDKVWISVLLRTLSLPFFFVCWWCPIRFFQSCAFQVFLVGFLALSNGILTNLAFLYGTSHASQTERDIVGRAMPLFLSFGIVLGSILSSAVVSLSSALHHDQGVHHNSTVTITV